MDLDKEQASKNGHNMSRLSHIILCSSILSLTSVAQKPQGQLTEFGVRRVGPVVIDARPSVSASFCKARCLTTIKGSPDGTGNLFPQTCRSYSWNSVSNRCELFPQPGDAVGNDDYVSGVIDGDPSLTIIYANAATWKVPWMADAPNIRCGEWGCRSKRFVQQIKASGMVPDIIFLTEVNLYSWGIVQGSREPYQALKLLHDELRLQLNIEYRIASANGVEAEIGLDRNGGVINQGEAVLYNPLRIVNKTMKNVPYITNSFVRGIGHRVPHDEATSYFMEAGAHLRASVPFCTSSFSNFADQYLDGPLFMQEDIHRTNRCDPSYGRNAGLSWSYQYSSAPGLRWRRIGQKVRLALASDPEHPIEFINAHLTQRERPCPAPPLTCPFPWVNPETIAAVPELVIAGPIVDQHMAPFFLNDINVNFEDSDYGLLLTMLPGWRVLDWAPGIPTIREAQRLGLTSRPENERYSIDTMGVLHGNSDPNYTDTELYEIAWKRGKILYQTRLVSSVWLPLGIESVQTAPYGTDLTRFPFPERLFGDHAAHIFKVESVEPIDLTLGPILKHSGLVETPWQLWNEDYMRAEVLPWCLKHSDCAQWLCAARADCG